jgi:hypothetical protein
VVVKVRFSIFLFLFFLLLTIFIACQLGCSSCDDQTGDCITCQNGFTQNPTDKTTCSVQLAKTSNGEVCPSATFQDTTNSTQCHGCAAECASCTGSSSNDCTVCANLRAMFNNSCVSTNSEGICEGSGGMIANNNNHKCEGEGLLFFSH